jgi:hypothetical protein
MKLMMSTLLVFALFASSQAFAERGVIMEHVPTQATSEITIAVVKQALLGRDWKIEDVGPTSVSASQERRMLKAQITIALENGVLIYDGIAHRTVSAGGPTTAPRRIDGKLPSNWVENLQRDITLTLAAIRDKP